MRDNNYVTIGKCLYVVNLIGLGILHFTGQMIQNFTLAAWMPLKTPIAYLTGLALVTAGVLILIKKYALWGAYLAATVFAIFLVFLLLPELILYIRDPGQYTFIS